MSTTPDPLADNPRSCAHCGGPILPDRRPDAIYCHPECARAAARERDPHTAALREDHLRARAKLHRLDIVRKRAQATGDPRHVLAFCRELIDQHLGDPPALHYYLRELRSAYTPELVLDAFTLAARADQLLRHLEAAASRVEEAES
jgi:hypothetical protein